MAGTAIAEMPNRKPRAILRALKDKNPSRNAANILAGKGSDAALSQIQTPSDSNPAKENHASLSQTHTSPKKSAKAAASKKQAKQKKTNRRHSRKNSKKCKRSCKR